MCNQQKQAEGLEIKQRQERSAFQTAFHAAYF